MLTLFDTDPIDPDGYAYPCTLLDRIESENTSMDTTVKPLTTREELAPGTRVASHLFHTGTVRAWYGQTIDIVWDHGDRTRTPLAELSLFSTPVPAPGIKREWATHTVAFDLTAPDGSAYWVNLTDDRDRTVMPEQMQVTWKNRGDGWQVLDIAVRGRLVRKTGGWGNATTLALRLNQLTTELITAIEENTPQ